MTDWSRLLGEHFGSVEAFAACAARIPGNRWDIPRAPGKWSPAEETEHIRLAYVLLGKALRDGYRARPMVSQRWATLLRWTVIPAIRMLGWFPSGARSPHDARPAPHPGMQDRLIDQVRREAATFDGIVKDLVEKDPTRTAYHPYFGDLGLAQILTLATGHTRHHLGHIETLV